MPRNRRNDAMYALPTAMMAAVAVASALAPGMLRVPGVAGEIEIPVTVDRASIDPQGERDTQVITHAGPMLLVIDGYSSQPQPMSRCQAGYERWVRVIDTARARESYAVRVESCLHDISPGHPVLTLEGNVITVAILGQPPLVLHVADDISVTVAP